jgi:3-oxoacyl-[acyl-carrier protein] reductase
MELGLKGKRVLVTGSSRGIGKAIGIGFLTEGASVVFTGRNNASLEELKEDLETFGPERYLLVPCDVSEVDTLQLLASEVDAKWGGIDVVVANAGSGRSLPDPIPPHEHFEKVFALNFDTAVATARQFLPSLTENSGNLILISSIAGMEAIGAPVDYSVAKASVIALSKNLARKVARQGVRVNCIAPGNVLFPGGSWDEKIQEDSDRIYSLIESTVPMNRFGTPEEIADACLFLASDRARFITGAMLTIDGGQTVTF